MKKERKERKKERNKGIKEGRKKGRKKERKKGIKAERKKVIHRYRPTDMLTNTTHQLAGSRKRGQDMAKQDRNNK